MSTDVIAQSQQLLTQGGPGSTYEYPPEFLATLAAPSALESLVRAWRKVQRSARRQGATLQVRARPGQGRVLLEDGALQD